MTLRWLAVGNAKAKVFARMTVTLLAIMIVSFVGPTQILVCARAGGGLCECFNVQ